MKTWKIEVFFKIIDSCSEYLKDNLVLKMTCCVIKPLSITSEICPLAELVTGNLFPNSTWNKFHFGFNGSSPSYMSAVGRILLNPEKKTNNQEVKRDLEKFADDHKVNPLWTIVLRYSLENWMQLMEYATTHELVFDMMFYNSTKIKFEHKTLFKCWMTQNKSCEYKLDKNQMIGDANSHFKKGGIKVIKKADEVVVIIRLLESGFYELYNYEIVN